MAVAAQPKKGSSAALPRATLDYLEVTFLLVFATFLLISWISFTLAEFGVDRPIIVLILGLFGLIAGGVIVFRRRWRPASRGALAGFCLPIVIGALLYFPPDEWILGALDPGGYVNAGAMIARTGSIVIHDTILSRMAPSVHNALFLGDGNRLPGFYLVVARFHGIIPDGIVVSTDQVVPHGFHLYPTVLAFGYALGEVQSELLVTPLLALIGLAGFYLVARRLFGTPIAATAALFLAIDPAQVWFARYPAAEILVQCLLFGGLLAFVAMVDGPHRWLAVLAGLALGSVHLAKIEMLPLPFLIAGYLGYQVLVRRFDRRWLWFVGIYLLVLVQAILHAVLIAYWYTMLTLQSTVSGGLARATGVIVIVGTILIAASLLVPPFRRRVSSLITHPRWETPVGIGLPVFIFALAVYAYFVRPAHSLTIPVSAMDLAQVATMNNLRSFVRLGWYVTPLGLLLGTLGWMLIAHHARDRRTFLLLMVIAADTVIFLDDMKITPIHYWAARRWVPLVIPGFCLAAAYLLVHLWPKDRKRLIQSVVPLGFGFAMTLGLLGSIRPLLGYVEYRGAIQQLSELAATFPANSIVLFADGDAGQRFSVPLEYLFERTSFVIPSDSSIDRAAGQATRRWLAEGHPVYWVSTPELPEPSEIGLSGRVVARQTISLPEKLATRDRPPGEDGRFQQSLEIWRLNVK